MSRSESIRPLPSFTALDADLVLRGEKRGASIQLDETYFTGQLVVLKKINSTSGFDARIQTIQKSHDFYEDINIEFKSLSRENLWTASHRFRELLQQLPEVNALKNVFPETCFVVPEWLRTNGTVKYGARIYFFRDEDAPDPEEILQKNIGAVMEKEREAYDRYHGRLHGYPDCCIEFFHSRTNESPPEMRSVEPYAESFNDEILDAHPNESLCIDRIITDFLDREGCMKFFASAFYPETDCDEARKRGRDVYTELNRSYPEQLVKDFFRVNFGISYLRARGVIEDSQRHPTPGILGKEHLFWYLPLSSLLTLSRYS